MLDLDSPQRAAFAPEADVPRAVPELIKKLQKAPPDDDWEEIWKLIAGQWSLTLSAYPAVPHLVRLLEEQGRLARPELLAGLARCACPLEREAECPAELRDEFAQALAKAAAVATRLAKDRAQPADDYVSILCSAAALSGRKKLGPLALSAAYGSEEEIPVRCPSCHEILTVVFTKRSSKVTVRVEDEGSSPATAAVVPAEEKAAEGTDFAWGLALAQQAGQTEAVAWLRGLAGFGEYPLCHAAFVPLDSLCFADTPG